MVAAASAFQEATDLVAQLAGLVVLAGTLAALVAFLYRWYVGERVPGGLSLLFGLAGVTVYLNTSRALGQVIGGSTAPTETEVALFNIAAFGLAAGGAALGRRAGDRVGADVAAGEAIDGGESDLGRLARSAGRVRTVELPAEVDDVVGYDPVAAETKAKLAGKTFLFPRRLADEELRERLVSRLRADYGVGHVDVDLADDGTVEYLALGSRAAGIGPTLPPATNAVALRADPAFAANAGDLVQVWETDPMRRVLTGELRGVAGDTVTVAIDAADTPKVDPRKEYRLVTLPVDDRPDREFASLLRAADETFSSVTVEAGSPLHGLPVGALTPTIVAVKPDDGAAVALPDRTYVLAPGETVFAIARPEALRRLERAAEPLDPSLVRPAGTRGTGADTPGADAPTTGRADSDDRATPASNASPAETPRPAESDDEAVEAPADLGSDDAGTAGDDAPTGDDGVAGQADASSFQELKAEFESGDAGWGDDRSGGDDGPGDPEAGGVDATERGATPEEGGGSEPEAGDAAPDPEGDFEFGDEDESGDDLSALSVDGPAEGFDLEDDGEDEGFEGDVGDDEDGDDDGDDDGEGEEDGDDDGDDGGEGGAKSFQELKAEFESGTADWEDEVSDSPGGDMRLDE